MSNCYYNDFLTGKTVRCRFNTFSTSTGAPASLAGGAVIITKDGADVTPSGGVAFAADVGGVVGRNHVIIDMSADTATFTAGSDYSVRLSAGTVGGVSLVGLVVGEWSVMNRSTAVDGSGRVTTAPASNAAVAQAVLTDTADTLGAAVLAIKAQTDKLAFTGANVNANAVAVAGQNASASVPPNFDALARLISTLQVSGPVWQFTAGALANAPTGSGGGGTDQWATDVVAGTYTANQAGAILKRWNAMTTVSGVADASPTASGFSGPTALDATDGAYVGQWLTFTGGANQGIRRQITGYTGSSRRFAFATPFPTAPANGTPLGDPYEVI